MTLKDLKNNINQYYPKNIDLNSELFFQSDLYANFFRACQNSKGQKEEWIFILKSISQSFNLELTEFDFLSNGNPSSVCVILINNYTQSRNLESQPLQLVIKKSALAPVYTLYFDNLVSDWNKRLIRSNPITENEKKIYEKIKMVIGDRYPELKIFDASLSYYAMTELGNISTCNKRKPYMDECLFGLYLSIHPHNILNDRPDIINAQT